MRFELTLLRAEARHQDHRALARMGPDQPHQAAGIRRGRTRSRSPRTSAARRRSAVDANLLHSSSEGKILEDPAIEADEIVYQRTISPEDAPDKATVISGRFRARRSGRRSTARRCRPAALLTRLNELGKANGIGRLDLVENRFVGMKSRGVYETPGGTILLAAHRGIESITLDREAAHLKDSLMPRYAELIYNGFWFSPERRMLQALIDESQQSRHRPGAAEAVQGQRQRSSAAKARTACIR